MQLAEAEQKEATLIDKLNLLIQRYYEASGALMTLYSTSNPLARGNALRTTDQIKALITDLRASTDLTPNQLEILKTSYDFFDSQTDSIKNYATTGDVPELSKFITFRKEFLRSVKHALGDRGLFTDFLQPQQDAIEIVRRSQKSSRDMLNYVVVAGFIGNVILATILLLLFNRHIVNRLNVLMNNAALLSKQTPLLPLPDGNDELNILDSAMQKAALELKEANQYRSSLMQMVAHDLRSPLTASQLTLDMLAEHESETLSARGLTQIERMRSNNLRLLALINDLLTLESLQTGKLNLEYSKFSIQKTVDECLNILNSLAQTKKIELVNACSNEIIRGDQKRIVQVIINFVSNAIKFSPPGSKIKITSLREGTRVKVSVTDQGVGIAESDRVRVFERFFQTTTGKAADGFGLGLAICKLIIESHEGDIGVNSEPGKGSCFWFKLRAG